MKPTQPQDLLKVDPFPGSVMSKSSFSLTHLTAYSVQWLDVWGISTSYENISVLNARLFPTEFSLAGFPTLPDGMRTSRTLLQMRPKYRGFATSDPRKGVYLTEKGKDAAEHVTIIFGSPSFEGKSVEEVVKAAGLQVSKGKERNRNPVQIIAQSKQKLLFRRFKEGRFQETDVVHLLGLVGLYDHSPNSEIKKELRQLRSDAETIGDREFIDLLSQVSARFTAYLSRD